MTAPASRPFRPRPAAPRVVLPFPDDDGGNGDEERWLVLSRPLQILSARAVEEVPRLLRAADAAVADGNIVAGFVRYEAAPAFDAAQQIPGGPGPAETAAVDDNAAAPPLAWMMICDAADWRPTAFPPHREFVLGAPAPGMTEGEHRGAVERIRQLIAAGDVYQVNLTYPLRGKFTGDPLGLFAAFARLQFSPWLFFAEADDWALCSASPECFFARAGARLESRPMKGTRPPAAAAELARCEKDRAENLMIVDMIRNDLSRIPGATAVRAGPLLQVERHPTVAQMTSSVRCEIPATTGLADIFAALFPCASVTGAPKIAAMRVIRQLEASPRGIYCGAAGAAFGAAAKFSVAIRAAVVDRRRGNIVYGVGGGIVADSSPADEWEETRVKASLLSAVPSALLIETMAAQNGVVQLLQRHLARLSESAQRLGFHCDEEAIRRAIEAAATSATAASAMKLRLTMNAAGEFDMASTPLPAPLSRPLRLGLSEHRVFSEDELLRHKTSRRTPYDEALTAAKARGWDDAILQNERGELTETCVANLAAELDGALLTPPVECGLLPGVMRAELLARGELREAKLRPEDLHRARALFRLNAVRGLERAELTK